MKNKKVIVTSGVGRFVDGSISLYHYVHKFEKLGHHPLVILAGRAINDSMSKHAAGMMIGD
ncbi:MAG: hypothetical protein K8S14_07790 [Actinomycetia bacterium]|nr:hypothetical protein [Actinomycetes bacterium]MCD4845425.1 hypothetical protein [Methanosarcinales archaeon]